MKQSAVRSLLSRLTEQLVLYFSEDGKITDTKEFSERLAMGTWEGLILLLRQSIANSDEVLLEEIGYLRKIEDNWIFQPAASLLEVDAMKLEASESHVYLMQKALFHLQQGTQLLSNIADDQELLSKAEAETPETKMLTAVFGQARKDSMLSDRLDRIGRRLTRTARRLRGELPVDRAELGMGYEARGVDIKADQIIGAARVYTGKRAYDEAKKAYEEGKSIAEREAESAGAEAGQAEP